MKKIISVLVALAMLISVVPAVFAEGETAYTFKPDGNGHVTLVSATNTGAYTIEREIDGATYYLNSTYFSGYGSRGWKILDADKSIIKNSPGASELFRIFYDSAQPCLQSNNKSERIFRVALSLKAPETTGFYFPVLYASPGKKVTAAFYDMYVSLYQSGKNSIDDYIDAKYFIKSDYDTPSWGETEQTGTSAIYTESKDEVVFAISNPDNADKAQKIYKVVLNPVLNPVMKTVIKNADSTVSSELSFNLEDENKTQTVALATTVSGTDITDMPVADSFITYKSSDEKVATVSAGGVITAVGAGTATIYAETSDKKCNSLDNGIAVTVTVPQPVAKTYTFNFNAINLASAAVLSEMTAEKTDKNGNNVFDTYGWRYFPTEGDATANESVSNPYYASVSNEGNSLIFNEKKGEFKFALMLKAPEIAAFYKASPTIYGYEGPSNARSIKMYMAKPAKDDDNFDYYAADNLVLSGASGSYANATLTADTAIYAGSNESIISAFWSSNSRQRFRYLTLDPILNPVMKTVIKNDDSTTSSAISLELNGAQAVGLLTTVSGTDVTDMPVSDNFITYKSSNEKVATVSSGGTITAVGEGTAKIYAETSDKKYSSIDNGIAVAVSAAAVPEEDKELADAFEVEKSTLTGYVESTVTGLTDNATIQAEKNSNGTFTLTALEKKEDAKFLYWAKGMSRDKKIVSFSNVLSNYMPEENGKNYLIAVYEDDISETAEYYNANGQRIATGTAPEYPSMAGYGKATGWARFGETNIYVAEYGNKTNPDNVTVTVDGKSQTVPYGTKITCKADDAKANFKCWKKSGINGKEEIVSAAKSYAFNAWENCTVTAVYEEHVYTGAKLKIIIDTFSVGNDTAVMAEFVGLDNAVEKGIMYNGKKIAMTKPGNQFTVMADDEGTFVGYAIIGNANSGYTLITDGSVTVGE